MSSPGHVALSLAHAGTLGIEQVKHRTLPKSVVDVCRVVYQAKCSLIKVKGFQFSSFRVLQPSLKCHLTLDFVDTSGAGPFLQGGLRPSYRTFEIPLQ